ncbi:MAG: SDR family NAD(P)-dependent oxidoreductase, partial [Acidimicrobiia bacterium]
MGVKEPPALGTPMLPPGTYDGKVVLISGGGTGLGKAMGVEFARLGATVVVGSRKPEHREAGVAAMQAAGGKGYAVDLDVRDPDRVKAAFDQIEEAVGPVDVLINNAAGNFPVLAEQMSPNAWKSVTEIVLNGTFFCSTEFARRAIASHRDGAVLNIGATYSWTGGPTTSHSAAAKAGVTNLTMSLAVEWAPYGIRVNCLAPGLFPHDDLPDVLRKNRNDESDGRRVPGGRVGRPHELGWAA